MGDGLGVGGISIGLPSKSVFIADVVFVIVYLKLHHYAPYRRQPDTTSGNLKPHLRIQLRSCKCTNLFFSEKKIVKTSQFPPMRFKVVWAFDVLCRALVGLD